MFCKLIVNNGWRLKIFFYFFFFSHLYNHKSTTRIMSWGKRTFGVVCLAGFKTLYGLLTQVLFCMALHISEHPIICLREKLTSSTTVRSIQDLISSLPRWEISNRQILSRNNWNSFPMQCSCFHTCSLCSRIFQLRQLISRSIHQPRLIKHRMEYFSYTQPVASLLLQSKLLVSKWCYWVWSASSDSVTYSCFGSIEEP